MGAADLRTATRLESRQDYRRIRGHSVRRRRSLNAQAEGASPCVHKLSESPVKKSATNNDTLHSRREILVGGAGLVAAASLAAITPVAASTRANASPSSKQNDAKHMNTITTKDGTQ